MCGWHHSIETKTKISKITKEKMESQEVRKKIIESRRKQKDPRKGSRHSEESKIKISNAVRGPRNPLWKGGISFEPYCPKFNNEFKERVRAFFGYQCVECGISQNGRKLHVHHVNFNKEACCDKTIPLFVSLCQPCHSKTNRNREYWEKHYTEIINKQYSGQCYIQKSESPIYI